MRENHPPMFSIRKRKPARVETITRIRYVEPDLSKYIDKQHFKSVMFEQYAVLSDKSDTLYNERQQHEMHSRSWEFFDSQLNYVGSQLCAIIDTYCALTGMDPIVATFQFPKYAHDTHAQRNRQVS